MAKPIVAVVGRPNVGKSTLFNKLVGERIAIVEDTPGVTRDRIIADAEWQNHHFTLIDTGGIEPHTKDDILLQMRVQAELAIDMADLIVLLVDGREGMTASDLEVANMIRKQSKNVLLAVNKVDSQQLENNIFEFYNLGIGEPIAITAKGRETLNIFEKDIPAYIREMLELYISQNRDRIFREVKVIGNYTKNTDGDYQVQLKLHENNIVLMELNINTPSQKQALNICDNWKNDTQNLYASIIKLLTQTS